MELRTELKKTLQVVGAQLIYTSKGSTAFHFTKHFQAKATSWGLTESDAKDVYYHGQQVKDNMLVRTYNGYELGIWYFKDPRTGQPVITSIWKRESR